MSGRSAVRTPLLRSTAARAVVPVAVGVAALAVIALALWGVAALISGNPKQVSNLAGPSTFRPGHVETYARIIDEDGPVMFPDLLGTSGDRTVVLHHDGDDPMLGWRVFLAHPADRPITCKVSQVRGTTTFTDCDGRTIDVHDLASAPAGVHPVVSASGILDLSITPANTAPSTSTSAP